MQFVENNEKNSIEKNFKKKKFLKQELFFFFDILEQIVNL